MDDTNWRTAEPGMDDYGYCQCCVNDRLEARDLEWTKAIGMSFAAHFNCAKTPEQGKEFLQAIKEHVDQIEQNAKKRDTAWLRYIAVLTKEYGAQLSYLSVHGYECPQWLIDFGYELRADIGITQEEVNAEIENMKEEMEEREQEASRKDQDQDEVRGEGVQELSEGSEQEGGGTEEGS